MDLIFVGIGLVILLFAGDILVRGAVAMSLRLGVPALVVSLTVVAFGTSAPEMLVAVQAALDGVPTLALGNVVGSNTANVLLVLGLPAIISGIATQKDSGKNDFWFMIAASILFILLCFAGPLYIWHGFVLLAGITLFLFMALARARRSRRALKELEENLGDGHMAVWKIALLLLVGIVGLPLGANLLIDGAVGIAKDYGVSEAIIGLTLIAVGTSLPELATSVMAALRRQADVAIGNVVGSNVFNLLAILGVASFFGPLPVPAEFLRLDLWIMLGSSLLLALFILSHRDITRGWGVAFIVCYVIYVVILLS